MLEEEGDPHLREQPRHELPIALVDLDAVRASRVLLDEPRAEHDPMLGEQRGYDLHHGLILKNAAVPSLREQVGARPQRYPMDGPMPDTPGLSDDGHDDAVEYACRLPGLLHEERRHVQ